MSLGIGAWLKGRASCPCKEKKNSKAMNTPVLGFRREHIRDDTQKGKNKLSRRGELPGGETA